ncbi:MAG: asparagine synthetase A [Kosmotoga sp.]|nr:MAG: asparagine synthetase A [Kosmotoga sp.]
MQETSISSTLKSHLNDERVKNAVVVKSKILEKSSNFLRNNGFVELLPTIISPVTDPLNHEVFNTSINYYNQNYKLTQSMIFHKQLAVSVYEKIFIVSPNIRLETSEKSNSGKHLFEFTQIDLEIRNTTREEIMLLLENLFVYVIEEIINNCANELEKLNSKVSVPKQPFKKISFLDAQKHYGNNFEKKLSEDLDEPAWLIDIPIWEREFYDKLSSDGITLKDMDLIWPGGFGEGLSGGEREFEYSSIMKRLDGKEKDIDDLAWYLKIAEEGALVPSAGCGFGVERFTRYLCNLDHVKFTRLFPKIPGMLGI